MSNRGTTIGITGAAGFVAWHLRCAMHAAGLPSPRLADRATFASPESIHSFVDGVDVLVHLAGVNRDNDESALEASNPAIAVLLIDAMKHTAATPRVIYASSTHEERSTAYGRSKKLAGDLFEEWSAESGGRLSRFIIPHVFGEGGRPYYNSAVATFCSQLANNETPDVIHNGQLELIHAQDLADHIIAAFTGALVPLVRVEGAPITVVELLDSLGSIKQTYDEHIVPSLDDPLQLRLFNTYRSYLYPENCPVPLTLHSDNRGSLFEGIKTLNGGQGFFSTTHSGIIRGRHYHRFKVERFLVVSGQADIRIRRMFDDKVVTFSVRGNEPCFVDIPTLHTHEIQNTGTEELLTFFWSHELFNPDNPDTIASAVILEENESI
jgi:UDP-2-acetamido-2,6-beta-L-arabino-hexul-4-ose reductase